MIKQIIASLIGMSSVVYSADKTPRIYYAELTSYDAGPRSCGWHVAKARSCGYVDFRGNYVKCKHVHKPEHVGKPVFNHTDRVKIVGQTASGAMVKEGLTLAMPRSFPFGTKVYLLDDSGKTTFLGVCQDRGSKKYIKIKEDGTLVIDVYKKTRKAALAFGRKKSKVLVVFQ